MYFKDSQNQFQYQQPRMVSSVRPPLVPDGYYGEVPQIKAWIEYFKNPWMWGVAAGAIILIVWAAMSKKSSPVY